jgi:hypothetical protein
MSKKILLFMLTLPLLLAACTPTTSPTAVPGEPMPLTVMTHDSFS